MANIPITYSADGESAISNQDDIKLTGMSVSADGSSWIACTDCYWTGNIFCGTVTATEEDFVLNEVKVFFTNDSTVLCSGSGGPITTLSNGQSLEISFNPKIECKELITNATSGGSGGGGGEIDPAVLDAKQDKAIAAFKTLNWQDEVTNVEDALQNLRAGILNTDAFAYNSKVFLCWPPSGIADDTITYWVIAPTPATGASFIRIKGMFTSKSDSNYPVNCQFEVIVNTKSQDNVVTSLHMQGVYIGQIPDTCDILLTEDQQVIVKIPGSVQCRGALAGGHNYTTSTYSTTAPDNVVYRMSTDCINLNNVSQFNVVSNLTFSADQNNP